MTKKFMLAAIAILTCNLSFAQSVAEIKRDRSYIFGEGQGKTIKEADKYALSGITSQILVEVSSSISMNTTEKKSKVNSSFEQNIDTYSSAILSNVERIIIKNEPKAHVFRYIRKADIERIFESRKLKIRCMIEESETALEKGQINDALRYLSWSHALTQSLLHPNEFFIFDNNGKEQMATVWIPKKIDDILSNIDIKVAKIENDELVYLNINYKSQPVTSLEYSYFDGYGWSNLYRGEEGKGVVELRKDLNLKKIQLKVEYSFEGEAVIDPEINSVLEAIPDATYKKAYIDLSLENITPPTKQSTGKKQMKNIDSADDTTSYPNLTQMDDVTPYKDIIDRVIIGIMSKSTDEIEQYFTPDGWRDYTELIGYGAARIVDATTPKYYALGEHVYCRNILMSFSFKSNDKTFMESVVFEFDEEKKISNVTFGLAHKAVDDIFAMSMWQEAARIILIHFLEGYQSAYALKQIDYIESIFADDAIIITGNRVRSASHAEMATINTSYMKYTTLGKMEYIRKLKSVFEKNEYININFANCEILKAGKGGEIYGIQIKQEYRSTNYGDTGYLFLLVDLNDIEKPIIHVRTWQEDQDPNFGRYGLGNF